MAIEEDTIEAVCTELSFIIIYNVNTRRPRETHFVSGAPLFC